MAGMHELRKKAFHFGGGTCTKIIAHSTGLRSRLRFIMKRTYIRQNQSGASIGSIGGQQILHTESAVCLPAGALGVCSVIAKRSRKTARPDSMYPLLWIISPRNRKRHHHCPAEQGFFFHRRGIYIPSVGMDFLMAGVLHFIQDTAGLRGPPKLRNIVFPFLLADVTQAAEPAFSTTRLNWFPSGDHGILTITPGSAYQAEFPPAGGLGDPRRSPPASFAVKTIRSPKLQTERYSVILITSLLVTAWETAYIFQRHADRPGPCFRLRGIRPSGFRSHCIIVRCAPAGPDAERRDFRPAGRHVLL